MRFKRQQASCCADARRRRGKNSCQLKTKEKTSCAAARRCAADARKKKIKGKKKKTKKNQLRRWAATRCGRLRLRAQHELAFLRIRASTAAPVLSVYIYRRQHNIHSMPQRAQHELALSSHSRLHSSHSRLHCSTCLPPTLPLTRWPPCTLLRLLTPLIPPTLHIYPL